MHKTLRRIGAHYAVALALWLGPFAVALSATASVDDEATIQRWSKAAEAYRSRGDTSAWAEALARRAEAYQRLGHRQQALADLEQARTLTKSEAPSALHAAILGALGQAYHRAGRPDDADATFAAALASAESAGALRISAAILNDRGALHAAAGRSNDAFSAFATSIARARQAGDTLTEGKALLNTARAQSKTDDMQSAERNAQAATKLFNGLEESLEKAIQLTAAAALLHDLAAARASPSLAASAQDALNRAIEIANRLGSARVLAQALGQLADLNADAGRIEDALRLNERALFQAQVSGSADAQFFAQWRAARLLQRSSQSDAALTAFRRALVSLAQVKNDLAAELWAHQESFTERIGPAYLGLADLLLSSAAAETDSGKKRAALREIQHTLETFRQIELEDYFRDDCVARYLARARGIEQVSARTAVLYPVPLPNRLELVVTIGEAIHQVTVPVGFQALQRETRALRNLLEKRTTYQYVSHARKLYDWIIRPIESVLAAGEVDTIVVVPDRPLRNIPLAALHDGRAFLVARFALATAPSLTLVEPRPLEASGATILASGLTEAVQGYAALPFVETELASLAGLRSGTVLRDRNFTTDKLAQELSAKPYSIVHVASHAQFEADSRRSFVLTYDGRFTIDRLEDRMKLNRFRDEPVELLFLSACQTAAGDERAALGLAGVAVRAGARSALATLWHINDQASSLLVAEFYRQVTAGKVTKAEALRRAQLSLFNDLRYRHPGYWSPFLVIGNWL